jgi:CopA family copper-resistance protein
MMNSARPVETPTTRRRFVQGLAAAGALAGASWPVSRALGAGAAVLAGTDFQLEIDEIGVNFTGRARRALAVNGQVPAPILRWREGDTVTLNVINRLNEPTSIHWHGLLLPSEMDGLPGLSFPGIPARSAFIYQFPIRQSGTYWYHSHSAFQEQLGLYGPIVIEPRGGYPQGFDRDYVVFLSDWSDEAPETILSNLKFQSDYYNLHQRTLGTFIEDARRQGLAATIADRLDWGRMRMSPTDILDVSGATYTYLLNGQPPAANWTALFRPGERVRLRFINGSAMSIFDVRIPDLPMQIVQADGIDVQPVTVDEFRIGTAETYDVIVAPRADRAFTIFVQGIDRTGFARGTLAPHQGMTAPVPPLDPRPLRTMADMGMDHAGMQHGSGAAIPGTGHQQAGAAAIDHAAMSHAGMGHGHAGMDHSAMAGMAGMAHAAPAAAQPPRPAADHTGMQHGGASATGAASPLQNQVGVDNVAMTPTNRLAEAGVGLDGNGRRVLRYSDLRALRPAADPRPPGREVTLRLTGNMERFIWGMDGRKFSEAGPIQLARGERVRFVLINDTMMEHPMHLHGMFSELENRHGAYRPHKHTIIVKPGERLSFLVTAVPGRWAFHCHLLFHMESGMFREVRVA